MGSSNPAESAAAQLKYIQELSLNTRALNRLAQLSETPAGRAFAEKVSAQSYEQQALRSRAEVASSSATRDYLETPAGQTASQEAAKQRVAADAGESLNALRQRTTESQARAERAATPQGMAETRERRDLAKEQQDAELRQAQADNIAKYGQLGGAITNAYQGFQRGASKLDIFVQGINKASAVWASVTAAIVSVGSAASPSAAATLNSSAQIAAAGVGQAAHANELMDRASYALQNVGAFWSEFAKTGSLEKAGEKLGPRWATDLFNPDQEAADRIKKNLKTDIDPRLQSKTFGSFEAFGRQLQTAGLNATNQQAANELLKKQLEILNKSGELLRKLDDNTKGLKNAVPFFG